MVEPERLTRKRRIDGRLRAAGWALRRLGGGIREGGGAAAVEEYPTESGPADYVLFADGRPLGVVEAKRVGLNPRTVLSQAEGFAREWLPRR